MNDKIKQLAIEAGCRPLGTLSDELQTVYNYKLAELVINECIAVLNEGKLGAPDAIGAGLNFGKVLIQEHFGVK